MHPIEEDLKKRIKKHYELFDPEEKIYLDGPAKDLEDPSFLEYQKHIIEFIKKQNKKNEIEEEKISELTELPQQLEEIEILTEEAEQDLSEDRILDIEIFSSIEKKVSELILYFDLSLFSKENEKEKLKNVIIEDMLQRYVNFYLTDKMKENIIKIIRENVEHEFREYQLKKKIRIKNLFTELKENFFKELENIILSHKKNKIKNITEYQKNNFIKYLINFIDDKYIKNIKREKKLNHEDYLILKDLSEKFIFKIYKDLTT